MDALCTLDVEMIESDYRNLFHYFNVKHKRRSLVLLFTELEETISSKILIPYIHRLSQRHLVLIVTLKDSNLVSVSQSPVSDARRLLQKGIAHQLLFEREIVAKKLTKKGALILDLAPEELSVALLNKYLEIKTKVKL